MCSDPAPRAQTSQKSQDPSVAETPNLTEHSSQLEPSCTKISRDTVTGGFQRDAYLLLEHSRDEELTTFPDCPLQPLHLVPHMERQWSTGERTPDFDPGSSTD